ncbi:protein OS-9-like isoform X2 [Dendronephthya gigantea]|uniref:protein OS-9-like isoform X2 n=1 Tax=Dendronephthya gigantea TaxID=151771 RepID=UPI00106C186E|nr:protein OS-9-like isoform X2 [Dendronephthya gigantea]
MATFVFLKILTSNVYIFFVSLCFVLRIKSTFLNIEELQKSKYGVDISAEPVLLDMNEDKNGNVMQITSKHGQHYQCVLPIVHFETKKNKTVNVTTEEINKLLEPLNNTCIIQINGWWSYKVCIGKSVWQYHDEGHEIKDNISLGHFSGNTNWSIFTVEEEMEDSQRYHSHFYSNGTVCDITGNPRKTEVRFFCGSQANDFISRIDEDSTCDYIINVYTDKLCSHSLFRPPSPPKKHSITCSPALREDQYKKYTEAQNKKTEKSRAEGEQKDNSWTLDNEGTFKEHDRDLKRKTKIKSEFGDFSKMMENVVTKLMGRIKQQKLRELPQDENNGEENPDDDYDDIDDNVDDNDDDDDIDNDIGKEYKTTQISSRMKRQAMEGNMNDLVGDDEPVEDTDRDDDVGWDGDNIDDDNMDIEGSSTPFKMDGIFKNFISKVKKGKKGNKGDHYEELIDHLKLQYRYFKGQLDALIDNMKQRIRRLQETNIGSMNPAVKVLITTIQKSIKRLENKQRIAEDAMERLTDLYDAFMEDGDYLKANEELADIRSTLFGLVDNVNLKSDPLEPDDDTPPDINDNKERSQPFKPLEETFESDKKTQGIEMEKPNLDKVVSKLKKIMTHENNEDMDQFEDDRISVRVAKIREKSEDLYDDKDLDKSFLGDEDENQLDEITENQEMREATKKMESIVRKQLQDAGVKPEGKIKVKIITSKEALQRVAGGEDKFQILTSQETNQFRDLLSNLLGGTQELLKEKKRQKNMEDNYNLVWNQGGLESADVNDEKPSSIEQEDENR